MSYLWDSLIVCTLSDTLTQSQILDAGTGSAFGTALSTVYSGANAASSFWASKIESDGTNSNQAGEDEAEFNKVKQTWDNATNNTSALVQAKQTDSSDDANGIQQFASFMNYLNQAISYVSNLLQTQYT